MIAFKRAGLSLIEVLITVAVIGILAGILIPAATATYAMAKGVACRSNLRQVGMATLAYAADHDDRLPAPRNWGDDNPTSSPAWFFRLPAYTGQRDVKAAHTIFQCASFRWRGPVVFTNASPKSFKVNGRLDQDGRPRHYRLGTIRAEHDIVLFIDSVAKETGMGQWGHSLPQAVDGSRHRGRVNLLGLDGHSSSQARKAADVGWATVLRWLPPDGSSNE